jgi:hypothetical protein
MDFNVFSGRIPLLPYLYPGLPWTSMFLVGAFLFSLPYTQDGHGLYTVACLLFVCHLSVSCLSFLPHFHLHCIYSPSIAMDFILSFLFSSVYSHPPIPPIAVCLVIQSMYMVSEMLSRPLQTVSCILFLLIAALESDIWKEFLNDKHVG